MGSKVAGDYFLEMTKVQLATLEMKYEVVLVAGAVAASPLPDPGYQSASGVHADSNRIDS